jgi:hypothetical protein
MFCNKCGCTLPAVAKFCAKCGSRVETSTAPPSSGSFCVDCGRQCDPAYKFCNFCGHPLPGVQNQSETKETVGPVGGPAMPTTGSSGAPSETPAAPTSMPAQIPRAPYAAFVLWFLCSAILFSLVIFVLSYQASRAEVSPSATAFTFVCLIGAMLAGVAVKRTWTQIVVSESSTPAGHKRRRRVLVKSGVFVALFFSISALVGNVIAENGLEAIQVKADLKEMDVIGDRISKARTPAEGATINWYVQMYEALEPDVDRLNMVLHRLQTEYPVYAARFPDEGASGRNFISSLDISIRRMGLLKREIAVAKKIDGLDESEWRAVWVNEMIPVMKEEDSLDQTK